MRHYLPLLFLCSVLLICFEHTIAQTRPVIQWQKCLGGTGDDRGHDVLINADGTLVVVGQTFSNDGDVSGNHGNGDAWVVKLDSTGNIIWQKAMGGSSFDYFKSVIATSDNAYLCIGYTNSNDGNVSGNHGNGDAWITKLDENGNTIWSKCFGGLLADSAIQATITPDNCYAIVGYSNSFGGGGWVFKINNNGDLVWNSGLNSAGAVNGYNIAVSEDQNLYVFASGYSSYVGGIYPNQVTIDRDPGKLFKLDNLSGNNLGLISTIVGDSCHAMCRSGNNTYVSILSKDYFYPEYCFYEYMYVLKKPDTSSSFTGVVTNQPFTNSCSYIPASWNPIKIATSNGLSPAETSSGIIAAGSYGDRTNYPYTNIYGMVMSNSNEPYLYGSGITGFKSIKTFPGGMDYVTLGYTNGNSTDASGFHGGTADCWVVKLSALNRIVGNIFIDANNNNIKDPGELPYTHASVKTTSGSFQQTSVAYNGFFDNTVATGNFTSTISLNRPYYTVVPASKNTTFYTYKKIDSVNFAVHPIPGIVDYAVGVYSLTIPRPGTIQQYNIHYSNKGTTTLTNKEVVFIKDPSLHYVSSTPPYSSVSGDSIKWNISSLAPEAIEGISLSLQLDPIPLVNLGDTIESAVYIDSTQDIYRADNYAPIRQVISGSFDPNDKQEVHGGFITPSEIASGDWLEYTIRFQNTGSDTAFTIIIKDTLSSNLQADSIEVIGTSHNCTFRVKSGQLITCTFNDIKLVDSLHNEPLSHGYVSYRIKPKSTLVLGDSIRNSASIYFDLNPPVKTNTQLTIINNRPVPAVWTGAISMAWEDPLNWSTGLVPDANTNVTINSGTPKSPVVNSNAVCRTLKIQSRVKLLVSAGYSITVLH